MFKNLHLPKQFVLILLVILFITVIFVVIVILPRPSEAPITLTPTPTLTTPREVTPFPVISTNPRQTLNIIWKNPDITIPTQLPTYVISQPLITNELIASIVAKFGFTAKDSTPTLKPTSKIYNKNYLSLFASTEQKQIQYNNYSPITAKKGFAVKNIQQTAQSLLTSLFPNATFVSSAPQKFFYSSADNLYPPMVSANEANMVELSFTQSIDKYLLVTSSPMISVVTLNYDSNSVLHLLTINGGFSKPTLVQNINVMDLETLKTKAPQLAKPLNIDALTSDTEVFTRSGSITLTVNKISLCYFDPLNNRQLVPAFLLEGIANDGTNQNQVQYIFPASI